MSKHSIERALERYNITLTKTDEKKIIDLISKNRVIPLGTSETDKNLKFAYVTYHNIPLKVLYQKTKSGVKELVTVYPFDADEYNDAMSDNYKSMLEMSIKFLNRNGYIVYKRKDKEE